MAGRIIDLGQPAIHLPPLLVVDTNLVVSRLLTPYYPAHIEAAVRTIQFFSLLRSENRTGFLPAIVCQEFFHLALRGEYNLALPHHRAALVAHPEGRQRSNWEALYKLRPDLIVEFLSGLERLVTAFELNNLEVLQPAELAPLPLSRRYEDELLGLVGRYQLDTADAALLLEAKRAGITSIATLDADFRRAQADFDIYTWL